MPNYDDHSKILTELERDQEAERERRETAREVHCFLDDDDGQWESRVKDVMSTQQRPRYTFDKCNDIVDDIAGEMEQADFDIKVKPAGGDASKDIAQTYDGLIRNIENLSSAKDVFNDSGRSMIRAGIDGWRVVQRYGDNDSFDQDLFIDPVADFLERVWFDRNSVRQTREDARHCWVLEDFDRDAYKARWPKGSEQSVNVDSDYFDAADNIVVGEILYKIRRKTRIVEMSNGAIYRDDEKYQAIKDELQVRGILEVRDRNRTMDVVMSRLFDGGGWLTEARETVFDYLPIIPTYGNFSVTKKKVVYWGIITKKLDAQRVYNYAESRKVEEGALAPLEKLIATDEQVEGHEDEWAHLNTSADPALLYTHVDGMPPPYKLGGAQINPGLETVSQSALLNLQSSSQLERLPGQPVGLRSGVAVELEQNKGDTRNYKYTVSQEKAICHTAKILVRAIPKVYDSKRQVRILNEDGSYDMVVLNEPIYDDESRQMVTVNDLSQGIYDVTCDVGPAFKNRQSETVSAFNELATIYPDILQEGADVYMQNVSSPGADVVAERIRRRMLLSGSIPEEQMTDEEKELVQSIEPEPDPVAEALQREADNADDKVELEGAKLVLEEQKFAAKQQQDSMTEAFDTMKTAAEELKAQADTMKILVEALGLDNPLVRKQAAVIADSQAEQP